MTIASISINKPINNMKKIIQTSVFVFVFCLIQNSNAQNFKNRIYTSVYCKDVYIFDSIPSTDSATYSNLTKTYYMGDTSNPISLNYFQHTYQNYGLYNAMRIITYYDIINQQTKSDTFKFVIDANCECVYKANHYNFSVSCRDLNIQSNFPYFVNIQHSFGDGNISYDKIFTHTYAKDSIYNYFYTISYYDSLNSKNCYDTSNNYEINTLCDSTRNDSLGIKANIAYVEDANNCKKIHFYNMGNYGTYTYWNFGDNTTSSSQNPTHTYANEGNYFIQLKIKRYNNISNRWDSAFAYDTVAVDCSTCKVKASIWLNNDSTQAFNGILYNYSSGNITNHYWNFGDGTSSTQASPTHTYTNSGTYTLTYYAYDSTKQNCFDSTSITFTIDSLGNIKRGKISYRLQVIDKTQNTTNINKVEKINAIKLFPNPASSLLNIAVEKPLAIEIYDAKGALIFQDKNNNETSFKIDISTWAKGLYILKCQSGESLKFIIE